MATRYYTTVWYDGVVKATHSTWIEARNQANAVTGSRAGFQSVGVIEFDGHFSISRMFLFFNTNGTFEYIDSAVLRLRGLHSETWKLAIQGHTGSNSTQSTLMPASNFTSFTEPILGEGNFVAGEALISLNQDGIDYINRNGYTKLCVRNYDYDYLNVEPPASTNQYKTIHARSNDYFNVNYVCYLDITEGSAPTPPTPSTETVFSVGGKLLSKDGKILAM